MKEKESMQQNMNIHDIVMYIRDFSHTEEECEQLLFGLQDHIAGYARRRMAETYSIPYDKPVKCTTCSGFEEREDCEPGHYRCKKRGVDGIDPYVKEPCSFYERSR